MPSGRVVLGAMGDPLASAHAARRLRDAGREVVYVGGHQTAAQLVRATVAEDAATLVVDGDAASLAQVAELCNELGAADVVLMSLEEVADGPRSR